MKRQDKLMTFTHLGEFSISKKELETRLSEVQTKLEKSIKEEILQALSEKDKETLKKYSGLYRIDYHRDSFIEKLFHSKKKPIVVLTQPLNAIMKRLPDWAYCYDMSLSSLERDLKNELSGKKRSQKNHREQAEKEARFKGVPFQDNSDDKQASINPEHICLVHATKYFPHKNAHGRYEIETLATATHLKHPRNTIHFSCNHHVESHMAGAWDNMPYVILSPMADISKLNHRKPMGISVVDTFYEMDVNENLQLPDSTFLIYPAADNVQFAPNQFVKCGKSHAIYKTKFTPTERTHLKGLYITNSWEKDNFEKLSTDEQDKMLSGFIKKTLVRDQLHQMGYETDWNKGDENNSASALHRVYRLGKRLQTLSSTGQALHSMTIFGINGINDYVDSYSPVIIGNTIDFLYALTNEKGILKKDKDCFIFTDDKKEKHTCRYYDLEKIFNDRHEQTDYLKKGLEHIHAQLTEKPELLTVRSSHVLQAWETHQKKLWSKSAARFFTAYPTLEKLNDTVAEGMTVKITPPSYSVPKKKETNTR